MAATSSRQCFGVQTRRRRGIGILPVAHTRFMALPLRAHNWRHSLSPFPASGRKRERATAGCHGPATHTRSAATLESIAGWKPTLLRTVKM